MFLGQYMLPQNRDLVLNSLTLPLICSSLTLTLKDFTRQDITYTSLPSEQGLTFHTVITKIDSATLTGNCVSLICMFLTVSHLHLSVVSLIFIHSHTTVIIHSIIIVTLHYIKDYRCFNYC